MASARISSEPNDHKVFRGDNRPIDSGISHPSSPAIRMETALNYTHCDNLRDSAQNGCHLCSLIHCTVTRQHLGYHDYYDCASYLALGIEGSFGSYNQGLDAHIYCYIAADGATTLTISELGRACDHTNHGITVGYDVEHSRSTNSKMHFALAKHWLKECEQNETHAECQAHPIKRASLPSRLLDLASLWHNRLQVKIVETYRMEERPRYATLSHCWGGFEPLRLNDQTENMFYQGVHYNQLPATFQDVIHISQQLGFEYLWIDSLCIRQDSAQDREKESFIMRDIYEGGALNISASWGADSRSGLFAYREPLRRFACVIPRDQSSTVFVFTEPISCMDTVHDVDMISSRGWVLQEQLFPPRTLHFGLEEMGSGC